MKIGNMQFEVEMNTSKARIKIKKMEKAFLNAEKATIKLALAMEKLQQIVELGNSIEINFCVTERKKHWWQFWRIVR